MTFASFAIGRLGDVLYRRYKAKHNGENPPPERRLDTQMYAYFIAAAGKVMFGWFVAKNFHPAAGLVASGLGKSNPVPVYTREDVFEQNTDFHSCLRSRYYHGLQYQLSD